MPQAATYIWDDKNQLEAGANEMKARADTIAKAWAYYYGEIGRASCRERV